MDVLALSVWIHEDLRQHSSKVISKVMMRLMVSAERLAMQHKLDCHASQYSGLYKSKACLSFPGVIEGTTPPDDSNMLCGAECASCNTATGQCTKCMEGAVLIMDATAPNQARLLTFLLHSNLFSSNALMDMWQRHLPLDIVACQKSHA